MFHLNFMFYSISHPKYEKSEPPKRQVCGEKEDGFSQGANPGDLYPAY